MTPMKLQEMLQEEDDEYYDEPMANANDELDRSARSASSSISKSRRFRSFLRRRRKGKSGRTTPKKSLSFFHSQYENCSNAVDVDDSRSINKTASKYDESQSLAAGVYSEGVGRRGRGEEVQSKRKGGLARQLSTIKTTADLNGGMTKNAGPSLFLQEASHLLSLLSAVAFATLRNDIESAESPLKDYKPGSPWPPTDPDAEDVDIPYDFYKTNRFKVALKYLLGNNRTAAQRTVYNACRPFSVLGGVSDAEIAVLQRARGPLAKTALCTMWLQEFISREFLNGAFGNVSPPIISRLFQYTSDGMIGYNQARKVAYIPFPFPHSQLTTFFLAAVTLFMPLLMLTFVNEIIVATILNTFAVGVFFGLWMVANELEDPFRNVPNDIPLNNFQAQFNEALVCMFAGFHPEAWWDIDERKDVLNCSKSEEVRDDELLSSIKSNRGNDDVGRNLNDELNASVLDRIKE